MSNVRLMEPLWILLGNRLWKTYQSSAITKVIICKFILSQIIRNLLNFSEMSGTEPSKILFGAVHHKRGKNVETSKITFDRINSGHLNIRLYPNANMHTGHRKEALD